jgi:hypothetical protein
VDLARDARALLFASRGEVEGKPAQLLPGFTEMFLGEAAVRHVAVVRDEEADVGIVETVDPDDLDLAPRTVPVPVSQLRAHGLSRRRRSLPEQGARPLQVIRVNQLEDAAFDELFPRVAEEPRHGRADVARRRVPPKERDRVEAVLDDGPIRELLAVLGAHGSGSYTLAPAAAPPAPVE